MHNGSILSDGEIREALQTGELEVSGWDELYIGPSSLDLHLDNKAKMIDATKVGSIEEDEFETITQGIDMSKDNSDIFYEHNDWNSIILYPQQLYILSTMERIKFSDSIVGFIQGRSSIARIGINVHNAGYFDAGFEGTATLEVTNLTRYPIKMPKGIRICQMVFARMGRPAEVPYYAKKDQKYQGQSGPTITGIHKDLTS